ncbi:unnamed protein product, partial [Urochloa humidicola]
RCTWWDQACRIQRPRQGLERRRARCRMTSGGGPVSLLNPHPELEAPASDLFFFVDPKRQGTTVMGISVASGGRTVAYFDEAHPNRMIFNRHWLVTLWLCLAMKVSEFSSEWSAHSRS